MLILRTVHGSHLYGTNHSDSDMDLYEVHASGKARQSIVGNVDKTIMPLDKFLTSVAKGVPQALEALYSPVAEVHPYYVAMLAGLRPTRYEALETYRRTIYNFYKAGDYKRRFHALRLCRNLHELWDSGTFSPRLPTVAVKRYKFYAQTDELTKGLLSEAPYRIFRE